MSVCGDGGWGEQVAQHAAALYTLTVHTHMRGAGCSTRCYLVPTHRAHTHEGSRLLNTLLPASPLRRARSMPTATPWFVDVPRFVCVMLRLCDVLRLCDLLRVVLRLCDLLVSYFDCVPWFVCVPSFVSVPFFVSVMCFDSLPMAMRWFVSMYMCVVGVYRALHTRRTLRGSHTRCTLRGSVFGILHAAGGLCSALHTRHTRRGNMHGIIHGHTPRG